jgi:hypothetical protein
MGITERIDRITLLTDDYRGEAPPIPKSVKIELTARCDFKCFFCASHMRLRQKSDMSWTLFSRVVREMRDLGVEELGCFYLGESFLVPWLSEAIRYAKVECGYPYVFLTTTGRMATADRIRDCMEAGLDSLKFSYNFADAEQFQEVTGVKANAFASIAEHVKQAHRIRDDRRRGHWPPLRTVRVEHPLRRGPAHADGAGRRRDPPVRRRALLAAALRPGGSDERCERHPADRRHPGPGRRAPEAAAVLVALTEGRITRRAPRLAASITRPLRYG